MDENKIDGPVAMLMALGRAMVGADSGEVSQGFVDFNAALAEVPA